MELATKFFEESAAVARRRRGARLSAEPRASAPTCSGASASAMRRPTANALKEHLAAKGVTQEQMIAAGLLVTGDDIPVSFDRFRDRVIFPIADFRGRIVGFGGRALVADVPAKYLNSPETELFHKGSLLYNGAEARKAAHDAGTVIAVEGYVDVIQMVGAGFAHTVAPLGTALTERQLQILWRMADEPILCFDGDKAGVRAAHRAADLALPLLQPGKSLRFALLPARPGPGRPHPRRRARRRWRAVHRRRAAAGRLVWARETEAGVFDTPERRAALEARLREIARGDRRRERAPPLPPGVRRAGRRLLPGAGAAGALWRPASEPAASGRAATFGGIAPDSRRPIPVSDRLRRSPLLAGRAAPSAPRGGAGDDHGQPSRRCSPPTSTISPISNSAIRISIGAPRGGSRDRRRTATTTARRRALRQALGAGALCRAHRRGSTPRSPPSGYWPAAPRPPMPTPKRAGCRL